MKNIYRIIPLLYFTGLGLFWIIENLMSTGTVNYIAIVVTLLIATRFFFKNRVAGLATGAVMGFFSVYMLLAMLSDLAKADEFTSGTYRFIAFGGGLFGVGVIMAILLIAYHAKSNQKDMGLVNIHR
ncbi:hypothetical protein AM493_00320 [Flavobacterium akiainvivens]|uniref:Uncharacterized protein n=1 Tax=Flavobacterium akiainvivens TaxID=1202724 RepID=A0A0M8MFF5_9FLAO|nr:hypothetical protein [Flavobacterium akiainvivens]KOS04657.1 hypothetical protein AM493_00320 [Flavobacterium akiainvivens]SFQ65355.1 hypothetical protein SAMN05444144_11259 [Flavobacterium akiainvivens]